MISTTLTPIILCAAGILFVLWGSFTLLRALVSIIDDDYAPFMLKAVVFLPYVILYVWCFGLVLIGHIAGILLIIDAANSLKKWWHS